MSTRQSKPGKRDIVIIVRCHHNLPPLCSSLPPSSPHSVRQPFTHKNSSGFVSPARTTFFCFSLHTLLYASVALLFLDSPPRCTPLFSILSMTIFQWTIQWTSSPRPSMRRGRVGGQVDGGAYRAHQWFSPFLFGETNLAKIDLLPWNLKKWFDFVIPKRWERFRGVARKKGIRLKIRE